MNRNKIDIIYFDNDECVMIITYPYPWKYAGMEYIQDKINLYLHYIESNQLYDDYPDCRGRKIRIRVVYDIDLTEGKMIFFNDLRYALNDINILFDYYSKNEITLC